ncbi:MAG: gliding motility-associated C-terminal domain-containing protein [Chitinophagaceae bacterium]
MKQLKLLLLSCLIIISAKSQTFTNSTGGAIPSSSTSLTCFPITVSGIGTISSSIGLSEVCMTINHASVDELEILLQAPDGTYVPLSVQNGNGGSNYTNTCFRATASTPIKFASAPFSSGPYLPEGHLGAVNNGQNANGTWNLCIRDRRGSTAGSLTRWSLSFSNTPALAPPALPSCVTTVPNTSSCASASLVCDFNGLCGNTNGTTIQDWSGSGLDGPCFGLQNNSFIKFIASSATASFSIWVPTTANGFAGSTGGIQMLFFSGTCGSGAVTTHGCYPRIFPYPSSGKPLISVIYASGLTPGNTYYLMIDGLNGDKCTFTIAANTGVSILNITPTNPSICNGQSVNLTASGGNGTYSWSPGTGLNTTSGATVTASPTTLGGNTYTVTSATPSGCPTTKTVTVTVNPVPAAPTLSVTAQPTCSTPTGTITITAPLTAGNTFSIDGSTYTNTTGIFTGVAPGSYNVTVKNSSGCISPLASVTVNNAPAAPAAPTASVTVQPTCSVNTGTITITAPTGAGFTYSVDGTTYTNTTGIFSGLTPGNYNVTVKNSSGCISPITALTVNAAPSAPAAPTASVTAQPTCSVNTGTITITAPTGAGFTYSVDGTTYTNSTGVFTGLTPGNYNVTVKNSSGCISAPTALTVNAAPSAPAAPTATVTAQPTCSVATGTITITAPTGAGFTYSVDGTIYTNTTGVFAGLAAGNYNVTVKNSSGCISGPTVLTVNAQPPTPAAPTASVTAQPTCSVATGTITITAPTGAGFTYSINGSTYTNTTGVFTSVAAGNYNVTVKNSSGCISTATVVTVNAQPTTPAAPTATVTAQPTCSTPTGTITITAPLTAGNSFSIDGSTYTNTTGVFSGLTPGNYNVTVKNSSGCISTATVLTVNAAPAGPAAPTVTVTAQPTCTVATGTITITAPTGAGLTYSINGSTYTNTTGVFTSVASGSYNVTVKNSSGCISTATVVTVNAQPPTPAAPTGNVTQPTCTVATGTITVTAPTGAGLTYSIDGSTYTNTTGVFNTLAAGNYNVTVKNSNGCISTVTVLTVNAQPATPVAPTVSVTAQPTCTVATGTITITAPTGAGLTYSIDGTTYTNTTGVFSGVASGNYNVTVKNSSGCISTATAVTVNAQPPTPAAPTGNVTQPTCTVATGTITVTAPTGVGLTYSIDGSTYTNTTGVFNNLAAGNYNVTVKNSNGCISAVTVLTVNAQPSTPVAPSANITQPTCSVSTGTITVTAPTGTGLSYSTDGTTYTNTTGIFSNLASGTYNVTVKNSSGCISPAASFTVNAAPVTPATPLATISVAPTCILPKGTVVIATPTGTSLEYAVNGGAYQSSPSFTDLAPGSYSFTVRNSVSGCVSAPFAITIAPPDCKDDTFIPNVFSPNGDGKNDILYVRGTNIKTMQLIIFNQWGEKVFESTSQQNGWNGTFKNKPQPVGVYVYVLQVMLNNGSLLNLKGSVTLIR